MASPTGVTELLQAWGGGDQAALERLIPVVYSELHRLPRGFLRGEHHAPSMQATALVNEAYLRLVDVNRVQWQDRAHFFAVAARMMRRVLVEAARARGRGKRGGGEAPLNLNESVDAAQARSS